MRYIRLGLMCGVLLLPNGSVHAESIWQDKNVDIEKRLNIAYRYLEKGKGQEVLSETETFIKDNPDSFDAYAVKTMVSLEMNKWDKAIESGKEMVRLKPNNFASRLGLGQAYGGKRLFDSAIPELNEAIKLSPQDPGAYYYLGLAYLESGQRDKAKEVERKLEKINSQAANELAVLLR